jgi:predicted NBD/HSP70 family sugar kinase
MVAGSSKTNTTRVLRTIWLNPGTSRVEIARNLNLNKSTISKIVNTLEELGVVEIISVGDAGPEGGRRPLHLHLNPRWGCVMGVEIQTEAFTVDGIDIHGDIFFSHTEPLDIRSTDLIQAFCDIVERFRPSLEATGTPLIGIGVGLPGFVDAARGTLHASMPLESYNPIEFVARAQEQMNHRVPILVDNDANCGCWGELAFKHSERPENFVFVLGELRKHTVEMDDYRILALGLGLVINGRVYHGSSYSAGEFRSILYKNQQVNQFSVTDDQAKLFLQDPQVNALISQELALHVAFLVTTLNLEKVVIGGPIELIADDLAERIKERLVNNWAYPEPVHCSFGVSRLGDKAVAYGAAGMFLEHLFTVPSSPMDDGIAPHGVDLMIAPELLHSKTE